MDYTKATDIELIHLLKQDDRYAYTQLYDRYNRLLFLHTYKRLSNREEAKDIVQDLFISLWDNRYRSEAITSVRAYLFTAVRNRIFTLIARQKLASSYVSSLQVYIDKGVQTTDHHLRYTQLMAIIEKEISELPEKMQAVFRLSRNEQLNRKEISEKLAISEQTVKKQVQNALKILKGKLGELFPLLFL